MRKARIAMECMKACVKAIWTHGSVADVRWWNKWPWSAVVYMMIIVDDRWEQRAGRRTWRGVGLE